MADSVNAPAPPRLATGVPRTGASHQGASQAYAAAASQRSLREQEAAVFRRANAMLRRSRTRGPVAEARALADNERLWNTVLDMVRDPANALPESLRASIASVGLAVRREMQTGSPDYDFLVGVNENIAAGLSGAA